MAAVPTAVRTLPSFMMIELGGGRLEVGRARVQCDTGKRRPRRVVAIEWRVGK